MTECCGQPRAGRFCSECGKALEQNNPLVELLRHCRKTEQEFRRQAKGSNEEAQSKPQNAWNLRNAARFERHVAKWKARGDALAELMAKFEGGGA